MFPLSALAFGAVVSFALQDGTRMGWDNSSESCGDAELCKGESRIFTGAFWWLDVSQALICAVASLVAATSVLLLLLFLLLIRLWTIRHFSK